jgi:hypothetical protein
VLQITDAALSTLPLEELLVELLARVRRAHGDARLPGDDRGEALLFCERGNRYRPAGGPG